MKKKTVAEGATEGDKPVLAVTCGDPCGVGPEIVLRAVAEEATAKKARLVVLGGEKHLRRLARELKIRWPFAHVVDEVPASRRWERPVLVDLGPGNEEWLPGKISAGAGKVAVVAIERAVTMALDKQVDGIVTAPIHKEALSLAGCSDPGHTEMLERLSGARKVGMLFWTPEMAVGLLSTHMSLREAMKKIRCSRIAEMLILFHDQWQRFFGVAPHIAVAALNPHAGEGGRFGHEEIQEIQPAIEKAREKGLRVDGPIPADSVFAMAREGRFDLVLALYHDQATIPVKLVSRQKSVNVTVGLPFVRTSVDHGTAMDIAGKGVASAESLVAAIRLAARLSRR
ncbi:MAG: 4-hydroxythreonine-4-phosphate dehydrogenase PdxA [Acidobacteriota bacterium]|nr:4-hydroxythreonine-4-phosphate dehydrogenase PdxA [Acidobacteriota bacterium]